jgi:3-deoxy-7-phosphoheptulonate synthase
MPVGFKNGTNGGLQVAMDGVRASAHPHHFLSVTKQGVAAIVATLGNADCHVILRGGSAGPNYDADSVSTAARALEKAGITSTIMIDCSHANSGKDHERQPDTLRDVAAQVRAGSRVIGGVMLESFLLDGRQDVVDGKLDELEYGRSITDQCMSWERTEPLFAELAEAVRERRKGA